MAEHGSDSTSQKVAGEENEGNVFSKPTEQQADPRSCRCSARMLRRSGSARASLSGWEAETQSCLLGQASGGSIGGPVRMLCPAWKGGFGRSTSDLLLLLFFLLFPSTHPSAAGCLPARLQPSWAL